jgi:hypothetical protein
MLLLASEEAHTLIFRHGGWGGEGEHRGSQRGISEAVRALGIGGALVSLQQVKHNFVLVLYTFPGYETGPG